MTRSKTWRLGGGIDLTAPARAHPGSLTGCLNYESLSDGYRRVDGYERFDGQPAPSEAEGADEAAYRRAKIGAVPGEGEILGVWRHLGVTYAFRADGSGSCAMHESTAEGWREVDGARPEHDPGRRMEFCSANFRGQSGQSRVYAVTGAGPAVEYDPRARRLRHLRTGIAHADDTPVLVAAYRSHLFLGYERGSVVHSALGDPGSFASSGGAAEMAVGDDLTGMLAGYRQALILFGRNSCYALTGASAADWRLSELSGEAGAMRRTAAVMDQPVCLDDRGIRTVSAAESIGDFSIATISERVRKYLDYKRDAGVLPSQALRVRRKSQYRLCFEDGECLVTTLVLRERGPRAEFTVSAYDLHDGAGAPSPGVVRCGCSVEDADGRERVFFALEGSGYVYEMDRGNTFDGHPVVSYLRTSYYDAGSPDRLKRWLKLRVHCDSDDWSALRVAADFHDDSVSRDWEGEDFRVLGSPSRWGERPWGTFAWDGSPRRMAAARLAGRGRNLSVHVSSDDPGNPPHVLSALTATYRPLREMR